MKNWKKILLVTCGCILLALGSLGVLLPILPTTPFVLLAAACFASSSPKIYDKLTHSKYFGEFILNYKTKQGVSKKVKRDALIFLWLTLLLTAYFFPRPMVLTILAIVAISVSIHILTLREKI